MRSEREFRERVLRAGVLALAAQLLTGCAAPIERRADGVSGGNQGWSSDASFSGPEVSITETWPEFAPELSRRDAVLGVQASASPYPLDVWPGEPLPRLEALASGVHQRFGSEGDLL